MSCGSLQNRLLASASLELVVWIGGLEVKGAVAHLPLCKRAGVQMPQHQLKTHSGFPEQGSLQKRARLKRPWASCRLGFLEKPSQNVALKTDHRLRLAS